MSCTYNQEQIAPVIAFHGHSCPGLSIGIRAAELAGLRWPGAKDQELVVVAETDMCGVDAIQFLLGCTYGKGNLIHKDHGKMAFSFFHRPKGEGFRALLRQSIRKDIDQELGELMGKMANGTASEEEKQRAGELRRQMQERVMNAPLEEVFEVTELEALPPRPARILSSLACEACGEETMESRTRRFAGQTLCIPCFEKVEQKV